MKNGKLNFDAIMDSVLGLITQQQNKVDEHHQRMLKQAEKMGTQDGSLNLPRVEDPQPSPHEGMLKHEYQKFIAELWKKGKPYLDGPHLEFKAQVEKIEDLEKNKKELLEGELTLLDKKKVDDDKFIQQDFDIKKLEVDNYEKVVQRDYLTAKSELEDVQERTGLNMQIFQKFGEAFFITVIMASSLAISIPVLAHFSGVFIKQRKEKKEFLYFGILCVLLFLIFNFGVSIFRAYVLAENIGEESSYLNIVIFTCLNLILFVIGVLAAYFSHDESYELEHAHAKFIKEKSAYDKEQLGIQVKMKGLESEKNTRLQERNAQYLTERKEIINMKDVLVADRNRAAKLYDELLNAFIALEAMVDAGYRIAVEKYRASNLTHRKNHLSPQSWGNGIPSLDLKFEQKEELDPN